MTSVHEKTIVLLSILANSGNLPHALLFTGNDGEAKKKEAIRFVKWLFHDKSGDFVKFDCSCSHCYQMDSRTHPDFYILGEEPIKIKQIRELKERFSFTPFSATKKVVIIDNADNMRVESANAFLKLLEEPSGDALIILLAKSRMSVLPTISSRAFEIRFISEKKNNQGINFFENKTLTEAFADIKKYNLDNKQELIELLNAWLLYLRRELLSESLSEKNYSLMKSLFYTKKQIQTTNTSPRLLMENLILNK